MSLTFKTYSFSRPISRHTLRKAKREYLIRLARFIGLYKQLDGMSVRQLSKLIYWRLTRFNVYERL